MSRNVKRMSGLILLLFAVVLLFLVRNPVLLRFPGIENMRGDPSFVVFNPFRDREPEQSGEQFLREIRSGRCLEVTSHLNMDKRNWLCQKTLEYPLRSWQTKDRNDENDKVKIFYKHKSGDLGIDEHMWLGLIRDSGTYVVSEVGIVY